MSDYPTYTPKGFEMYPYAPRSTEETMLASAFRRYLVPPDTHARTCPFCGGRVYWINEEPEYVDEDGRTIGAYHDVVDAETDVAGTLPEPPHMWGSGISHGSVCEIPRPLPERSPDRLATSTKNSNVPGIRKVRVPAKRPR